MYSVATLEINQKASNKLTAGFLGAYIDDTVIIGLVKEAIEANC